MFISEDIYELADSFLRQDDITLIEMKDYIKNPKPSGYRSLHNCTGTNLLTEDKEVCLCRSTASYYCDGFLGKFGT